VRLLLNAPQHAAHADCGGGVAFVQAADCGHMEVVRTLQDHIDGKAKREHSTNGGHFTPLYHS